jgi:TldD protein
MYATPRCLYKRLPPGPNPPYIGGHDHHRSPLAALPFRPAHPEEAQALTREALQSCDDGELYLQFIASESFGFDDGRLKTADYSRDAGFGLRGVSGEMTGFAHANEISAAAIRRAGETLRCSIRQGPAGPAAALNNRHLYTDASPLDARALCRQGEAAGDHRRRRARPRSARGAGLREPIAARFWSVVEIVRADGFRSPPTSARWCGSTSR